MKLVICYTPLHALILKRLREEGLVDDYYLLYICFDSGLRHKQYFNKAGINGQRKFLVLKRSLYHDFYKLFKILRGLSHDFKFTGVVTGNLKHSYSRFSAYVLRAGELSTFDDGSGNISGAGYLYEANETFLSQMFFSLCAKNFLYKNCLSRIVTHYTIYDFDNLVDAYNISKIKISLLRERKTSEIKKLHSIAVYLGNCFCLDGELSERGEFSLDEAVVKRYKIDLYLPHPRRERLIFKNDKKYTKLLDAGISEDIVLSLLDSYSQVNLFGCYSSVMLNLSQVEGVSIKNIHVDLNKPTNTLEKIFERLGISTDKKLCEQMIE
jgi:hypothetical protein